MKKYEGDKTALCAYFHFMLGIPIPNAVEISAKKTEFSFLYTKKTPQKHKKTNSFTIFIRIIKTHD